MVGMEKAAVVAVAAAMATGEVGVKVEVAMATVAAVDEDMGTVTAKVAARAAADLGWQQQRR